MKPRNKQNTPDRREPAEWKRIMGGGHGKSVAVGRFVTIAAVADLLGVCERTVRRWIDRKDLPKHDFGSITRIGERDLQAFIDRARRGPAVPHNGGPLDEEFYTAQQVAELLDVCLRTVRRLIDAEVLKSHNFGVIRIAASSLRDYCERSRRG